MRSSHALIVALALIAAPAAAADKVSPELARAFAAASNGRAEMLIVMREQADLAPARGLSGKLAKGRFVFEQLTETARRSQAPLLAELARLGAPHRSFWAANFVWTEGDSALAQKLAARADVARLDANPRLVLQAPVADPEDLLPRAPAAIEWNITQVNADDVWALPPGYTGQGAVIAGQDTGYQWDHPALKDQYRGWNGSVADHNYNWHDAIHTGGSNCGADSPVPCDDTDHGTHTMGTMVGDDGGTNQIGMAPGARWIGCRNMNEGAGTPTTYIECFEWFIAPTDLAGGNPNPAMAPDVINNSWGCPESEGCSPGNFVIMQEVVERVRAAGIFVVVSAGNDGSACSTVNTPAAIYDAVFSVGSTTSTEAASSFSSRGPVTVDGSNRMKPDIAAPGSGVRSAVPGGGYSSMSGTSMAGPHVAGLVGLMISAVPAAAGNIDLLEDLIRQSAFHPVAAAQVCGGVNTNVFPNNTFGSGRIDALAAVQLLLSQADFQTSLTPATQAVCSPTNALFDVAVGQLGDFAEPVTLSATGNPVGSTVDFSTNPVPPPGASLLTVTTAGVAAGASTITVTGTALPSGLERSDTATLAVFTAGAAARLSSRPANAATNVAVRPTFTWSAATGAAGVSARGRRHVPTSRARSHSAALAGTSHTPGVDLPSNTELYWRVTASNPCASAVSPTFSLHHRAAARRLCRPARWRIRSTSTVSRRGKRRLDLERLQQHLGTVVGAGPLGRLRLACRGSSTRPRISAWSRRRSSCPAGSCRSRCSSGITRPRGSRSGGCCDGGRARDLDRTAARPTPRSPPGLLTDPYDGPISAVAIRPRRSAWCGDPQDWLRSVVDLAGLGWPDRALSLPRDHRQLHRPGARRLVSRRHPGAELLRRHDAVPRRLRGRGRLAVDSRAPLSGRAVRETASPRRSLATALSAARGADSAGCTKGSRRASGAMAGPGPFGARSVWYGHGPSGGHRAAIGSVVLALSLLPSSALPPSRAVTRSASTEL